MTIRRWRGLGLVVCVVALLGASLAHAAFIGEDIGATSGGSSTPSGVQPPDQVAITADGGDIWGNADAFHYYHDSWSGDFNAVVRFMGLAGGTDSWRKAGIMARATTAPGSVQTVNAATPQRVSLQWRDSTNGGSGWPNIWVTDSPGAGSAPFWLSLSRRGNTFTARWAPDSAGSPGFWSGVTPASDVHTNPGMPAGIELGLAVTSHNTGQLTTATFEDLTIGNWEAVGDLQMAGNNVAGKAFARDRDTLGLIGPVHWKVEQIITTSVDYNGPGVRNEWFPNQSFSAPTIVPPFATDRIDWWSGSYPAQTGWTGGHDSFSVRYGAQFYADHNGNYSFEEHVDDEAWLVIDGSQVLHDGTWNSDTFVTVPLTTGWHDLEFRTREGGGGDYGRLRWDPTGGTSWQVMTNANALFQTSFTYTQTTVNLLGEGWGNIGDDMNDGLFGIALTPGTYDLRLTVDYLGETTFARNTFLVPEPTTCLLLGGGLLALLRRRRRSK